MKVTWIRTPEPSERKSSDPLRFLFGSSVCYPPFAKTRRIAAQTIARWRKLTQTSRRKPRMVSAIFFWRFWLFCFLHNLFFFCKASLHTVQNLLSRQRSLKRIGISCQSIKDTNSFILSQCGRFWFLRLPAYIGGAEGCFLPACMYYIEKPENAFTMLDGKKQKHRDHREASVARSVLISATERLSEPQGGEFSRMADNRCTDRVGNAVGHGFWLFADSILIKHPAFQFLTPARKSP